MNLTLIMYNYIVIYDIAYNNNYYEFKTVKKSMRV